MEGPMSDNDNQQLVHWKLLDNDELVESCQTKLQTEGVVVLENFVTEWGVSVLKDEVKALPYNVIQNKPMTPWLDGGDMANYSKDHPRNFMINASVGFVGRKQFESSSSDHRLSEEEGRRRSRSISLYNNDKMLHFLSSIAGRPLYRSNDVNGSVYSYRLHYKDHNAPPWHFDESPYTAILYLENSTSCSGSSSSNAAGGRKFGGGEFEFVPWVRPSRSKDDCNGHDIVQKIVVDKNLEDVRRVSVEPGTFLFFCGAHTFHRAGPIQLVGDLSGNSGEGGETNDDDDSGLRIGLVFTFSDTQEFSNSDEVNNRNEWDPKDD